MGGRDGAGGALNFVSHCYGSRAALCEEGHSVSQVRFLWLKSRASMPNLQSRRSLVRRRRADDALKDNRSRSTKIRERYSTVSRHVKTDLKDESLKTRYIIAGSQSAESHALRIQQEAYEQMLVQRRSALMERGRQQNLSAIEQRELYEVRWRLSELLTPIDAREQITLFSKKLRKMSLDLRNGLSAKANVH